MTPPSEKIMGKMGDVARMGTIIFVSLLRTCFVPLALRYFIVDRGRIVRGGHDGD